MGKFALGIYLSQLLQKVLKMKSFRAISLAASTIAAIAFWAFIIHATPHLEGARVPSSAPSLSSTPTPKIVLWFGDSYGTGTGATNSSKGYVSIVSRSLQFYSENLSEGGSGYLHYGSGKFNVRTVCGTFDYGNYLNSLEDNTCLKTDYVFVTGGRNDTWSPQLVSQINKFYDLLHKRFPKATVVAFSPILGLEPETSEWLQFKDAVRKAVIRNGGLYADIGEPLKRDINFMWTDKFHPNDLGYALIAKSMIASLKELLTF